MQLTKVINNNEELTKNSVKSPILYSVLKRSFDIILATAAIAILSPILILTALVIRLSSKGPVIFWQKRAGIDGKIINFPKFRSMYIDAEERKAELLKQNMHDNSITFKMKKDPRITPIGRILRKFSVDELPQLLLVLTGELSLVGPRPATLDEVEQYSHFEKKRLSVTPGLTCIWQVSGRGDIPFKEQVFMDYKYICERNFWLDLKLIILTVPAVVLAKGAY